MKVLPLFIVILIVIACENPGSQNARIVNSTGSTSYEKDVQIPPPIDIHKILNSDRLFITSGITTNNESKYQCNSDSIGFYGHYQLISKLTDKEVGQLTVFVHDSPDNWRKNSQKQKFSELTLYTDDFMIWDSISVGLSESKLLNIIDDKFHYKKGTTLFAEFGEFESAFTIVNDTINKLRIGKSCK